MSVTLAQNRGGERVLDLFIVAGDISGDDLGGKLMLALTDKLGARVNFRGVGGVAMDTAGLQRLFPTSDIAVMGILPVIANLPRLLNRIGRTVDAIVSNPPDALVIIDSPDFTHRVARQVRRQLPNLPVIDYVSPSVWAWRPGRARRMRPYVDHILALLPFEPQAHRDLGGPDCTYVGHPLIERLPDLHPNAGETLRRETAPPVVLVLPGSRPNEVARLLPVFCETINRVQQNLGEIEVIIPAVAHLAQRISEQTASWSFRPRIVVGEAEKYAAFRQARAALAASGTVTLELALAHVPVVVAYKVSKLEEMIARRLVKTKWMSLPNIILGEAACPEFLQEAANPESLAKVLQDLIEEGEPRRRQLKALMRMEKLMYLDNGERPSERAARVVIEAIAAGKAQS